MRALFVPVTALVPGIDTSNLTLGTSYAELEPAIDINKGKRYAHDPEVEGSVDTSDSEAYAWSAREALTMLYERDPELFASLQKRFKGKVLIDLGSGNSEFGYQVAQVLEARAYVAVDPFHASGIGYTLGKGINKGERIPYAAVPEDALRFLQRLPSDADVAFFSSGTDAYIIGNKSYVRKVDAELKRLLNAGNAILFNESIFGYGSVNGRDGMQTDPDFTCVPLGRAKDKCVVFRKEDKTPTEL